MKIKANIKKIDNIFKKNEKVFLIGHINSDLDAISSCLALANYLKTKQKDTYIILDDQRLEPAVKKVYESTNKDYKYIKSKDIKKYINKKSLLILCDFNRLSLLKDKNIVEYFNNSIIIDHHEVLDDTYQSDLNIIDLDSSSAAEMISEYLKIKKYDIPNYIATYLLSGIVLDTNGFSLKVRENTFNVAAYLIKEGADNHEVQKLFKENINKYRDNQKVILNAEIKNNIAITLGVKGKTYRREDLGRISDNLLQFEGIKASFVIAKLGENKIGISARSASEKINVSEILKHFDGGGNQNQAGALIKDKSLNQVKNELIEYIK